ncbi:adenylosuccinate lyase family protein [Polaromonas sp.]|uniref:class-II fumarase/aspartase family protein n=1 Tax=Polaromonas sp. TaxID=1869339 RepID=UPI003265C40D
MNQLFSYLHDGGAIADIFSEKGFVDRCLRFERELAGVQAGLGLIPREAADEIRRVALIDNIDLVQLKQKTRLVGLPVVGLVSQLVGLCRGDLGQYVHYGATTQDVMDCALALQMQEALALVGDSLSYISARLDDLAVSHQGSIQAGRTNQQHALPITFGFKAAVWNSGVRRQMNRLDQVQRRVATGQLGGAVGTLASFSGAGHETRRCLMQELGLDEPAIAWHCMRDGPTEAVLLLSQIAATLGKIGRDMLMLSSTEVGELAFAADRGASSTMPQKNNPVAASSVVALSRMLFHTAPMMLDASLVENERSLDSWYVELHAVPQCFCLMGALLGQARTMLEELVVDAARMAGNTAMTAGAIVSETVQMELARSIGLNRAHELVARACQKSKADEIPLAAALTGLHVGLDETTVASLLDVARHLPFCVREVEAARLGPTPASGVPA